MAKIVLDTVAGGFDLSVINNNFDKIETEFQNKVLYRDNPVGEPNALQTDVDANAKRIFNLPVPTLSSEAARLQDVQNAVAGGAANLISFVPYGNIAAANLQAALQEEIDDLGNTSTGASLIGVDGTTLSTFLKDRNNKVVDSITALKAIDKTKFTRAFVTGYYTAGDGGGGMYWFDSTDTTSADNGGTIIVATDSGRWKLIFTDLLSAKQFGAKGDGATNDTAFMQAAHNTGKLIFYPAGTYRFTTISFSAGGIVGTGKGTSVLQSTDATSANLITFTGTGGDSAVPLFRDFKLEATATKAAGAGIAFIPSSSELSYPEISSILIFNVPRSLDFRAVSKFHVSNCDLINYTDTGIFVANTNDIDSGDSIISGCFINTGQVSGNRFGIFQESSGGLRIIGNKILGGTAGYNLNYKANTQSGPLIITGNSIENVAGFAIFLGHTATFTGIFGGIVISGNEIAVCDNGISTDTSGAFTLLTVTGNYIDLNNSTGKCLNIKADKFIILGNTFQGGLEGLRVDVASTNGRIGKNLYSGNTTAIINNSTTTYIDTDVQNGIEASISHTTAFGNVFYGSSAVTFPVAFKTVPVVNCNAGGAAGVAGGFCGYATNVTITGFTYNLVGAISGSTSTNKWSARGVI